jgi:hypothetical protein
MPMSLLRYLRRQLGISLSGLAENAGISTERASVLDDDPAEADSEERERTIWVLSQGLYDHFEDVIEVEEPAEVDE